MEDTRDLIDRLCTAAGMIMEDSVDIALVRGSAGEADARIRQIAQAAYDVGVIAEAARVVHRRWS